MVFDSRSASGVRTFLKLQNTLWVDAFNAKELEAADAERNVSAAGALHVAESDTSDTVITAFTGSGASSLGVDAVSAKSILAARRLFLFDSFPGDSPFLTSDGAALDAPQGAVLPESALIAVLAPLEWSANLQATSLGGGSSAGRDIAVGTVAARSAFKLYEPVYAAAGLFMPSRAFVPCHDVGTPSSSEGGGNTSTDFATIAVSPCAHVLALLCALVRRSFDVSRRNAVDASVMVRGSSVDAISRASVGAAALIAMRLLIASLNCVPAAVATAQAISFDAEDTQSPCALLSVIRCAVRPLLVSFARIEANVTDFVARELRVLSTNALSRFLPLLLPHPVSRLRFVSLCADFESSFSSALSGADLDTNGSVTAAWDEAMFFWDSLSAPLNRILAPSFIARFAVDPSASSFLLAEADKAAPWTGLDDFAASVLSQSDAAACSSNFEETSCALFDALAAHVRGGGLLRIVSSAAVATSGTAELKPIDAEEADADGVDEHEDRPWLPANVTHKHGRSMNNVQRAWKVPPGTEDIILGGDDDALYTAKLNAEYVHDGQIDIDTAATTYGDDMIVACVSGARFFRSPTAGLFVTTLDLEVEVQLLDYEAGSDGEGSGGSQLDGQEGMAPFLGVYLQPKGVELESGPVAPERLYLVDTDGQVFERGHARTRLPSGGFPKDGRIEVIVDFDACAVGMFSSSEGRWESNVFTNLDFESHDVFVVVAFPADGELYSSVTLRKFCSYDTRSRSDLSSQMNVPASSQSGAASPDDALTSSALGLSSIALLGSFVDPPASSLRDAIAVSAFGQLTASSARSRLDSILCAQRLLGLLLEPLLRGLVGAARIGTPPKSADASLRLLRVIQELILGYSLSSGKAEHCATVLQAAITGKWSADAPPLAAPLLSTANQCTMLFSSAPATLPTVQVVFAPPPAAPPAAVHASYKTVVVSRDYIFIDTPSDLQALVHEKNSISTSLNEAARRGISRDPVAEAVSRIAEGGRAVVSSPTKSSFTPPVLAVIARSQGPQRPRYRVSRHPRDGSFFVESKINGGVSSCVPLPADSGLIAWQIRVDKVGHGAALILGVSKSSGFFESALGSKSDSCGLTVCPDSKQRYGLGDVRARGVTTKRISLDRFYEGAIFTLVFDSLCGALLLVTDVGDRSLPRATLIETGLGSSTWYPAVYSSEAGSVFTFLGFLDGALPGLGGADWSSVALDEYASKYGAAATDEEESASPSSVVLDAVLPATDDSSTPLWSSEVCSAGSAIMIPVEVITTEPCAPLHPAAVSLLRALVEVDSPSLQSLCTAPLFATLCLWSKFGSTLDATVSFTESSQNSLWGVVLSILDRPSNLMGDSSSPTPSRLVARLAAALRAQILVDRVFATTASIVSPPPPRVLLSAWNAAAVLHEGGGSTVADALGDRLAALAAAVKSVQAVDCDFLERLQPWVVKRLDSASESSHPHEPNAAAWTLSYFIGTDKSTNAVLDSGAAGLSSDNFLALLLESSATSPNHRTSKAREWLVAIRGLRTGGPLLKLKKEKEKYEDLGAIVTAMSLHLLDVAGDAAAAFSKFSLGDLENAVSKPVRVAVDAGTSMMQHWAHAARNGSSPETVLPSEDMLRTSARWLIAHVHPTSRNNAINAENEMDRDAQLTASGLQSFLVGHFSKRDSFVFSEAARDLFILRNWSLHRIDLAREAAFDSFHSLVDRESVSLDDFEHDAAVVPLFRRFLARETSAPHFVAPLPPSRSVAMSALFDTHECVDNGITLMRMFLAKFEDCAALTALITPTDPPPPTSPSPSPSPVSVQLTPEGQAKTVVYGLQTPASIAVTTDAAPNEDGIVPITPARAALPRVPVSSVALLRAFGDGGSPTLSALIAGLAYIRVSTSVSSVLPSAFVSLSRRGADPLAMLSISGTSPLSPTQCFSPALSATRLGLLVNTAARVFARIAAGIKPVSAGGGSTYRCARASSIALSVVCDFVNQKSNEVLTAESLLRGAECLIMFVNDSKAAAADENADLRMRVCAHQCAQDFTTAIRIVIDIIVQISPEHAMRLTKRVVASVFQILRLANAHSVFGAYAGDCLSSLCFLALRRGTDVFAPLCEDGGWVDELICGTSASTPMRAPSMRILSAVLCEFARPESIIDLHIPTTHDTSLHWTAESIAKNYFNRLSTALGTAASLHSADGAWPAPAPWKSTHFLAGADAEVAAAISLFRKLLAVPAWQPVVCDVIESSIQAALDIALLEGKDFYAQREEPILVSATLRKAVRPVDESTALRVFQDALAALAIVGGVGEILRAGGLALLPLSDALLAKLRVAANSFTSGDKPAGSFERFGANAHSTSFSGAAAAAAEFSSKLVPLRENSVLVVLCDGFSRASTTVNVKVLTEDCAQIPLNRAYFAAKDVDKFAVLSVNVDSLTPFATVPASAANLRTSTWAIVAQAASLWGCSDISPPPSEPSYSRQSPQSLTFRVTPNQSVRVRRDPSWERITQIGLVSSSDAQFRRGGNGPRASDCIVTGTRVENGWLKLDSRCIDLASRDASSGSSTRDYNHAEHGWMALKTQEGEVLLELEEVTVKSTVKSAPTAGYVKSHFAAALASAVLSDVLCSLGVASLRALNTVLLCPEAAVSFFESNESSDCCRALLRVATYPMTVCGGTLALPALVDAADLVRARLSGFVANADFKFLEGDGPSFEAPAAASAHSSATLCSPQFTTMINGRTLSFSTTKPLSSAELVRLSVGALVTTGCVSAADVIEASAKALAGECGPIPLELLHDCLEDDQGANGIFTGTDAFNASMRFIPDNRHPADGRFPRGESDSVAAFNNADAPLGISDSIAKTLHTGNSDGVRSDTKENPADVRSNLWSSLMVGIAPSGGAVARHTRADVWSALHATGVTPPVLEYLLTWLTTMQIVGVARETLLLLILQWKLCAPLCANDTDALSPQALAPSSPLTGVQETVARSMAAHTDCKRVPFSLSSFFGRCDPSEWVDVQDRMREPPEPVDANSAARAMAATFAMRRGGIAEPHAALAVAHWCSLPVAFAHFLRLIFERSIAPTWWPLPASAYSTSGSGGGAVSSPPDRNARAPSLPPSRAAAASALTSGTPPTAIQLMRAPSLGGLFRNALGRTNSHGGSSGGSSRGALWTIEEVESAIALAAAISKDGRAGEAAPPSALLAPLLHTALIGDTRDAMDLRCALTRSASVQLACLSQCSGEELQPISSNFIPKPHVLVGTPSQTASSWRSRSALTPVVVLPLKSDKELLNECGMSFASWVTDTIIRVSVPPLIRVESEDDARNHASPAVDFGTTVVWRERALHELFSAWALTLRSPALFVKLGGLRRLTLILEHVMALKRRTSSVSFAVEWKQYLGLIPISRLRALTTRWLSREFEDAPRHSRYLQVLVEFNAVLHAAEKCADTCIVEKPPQFFLRLHGTRVFTANIEALHNHAACSSATSVVSYFNFGPHVNSSGSTPSHRLHDLLRKSPSRGEISDGAGGSGGYGGPRSRSSRDEPWTLELWLRVYKGASPSAQPLVLARDPRGSCILLDVGNAAVAENAQSAPSNEEVAFSPGLLLISSSEQTANPLPWPSARIPAGRWVHVAVVSTIVGAMLFIDSVPSGVLNWPDDGRGGLQHCYAPTIGLSSHEEGSAFEGDVHEVRLWRVARTPAEIFRDFRTRIDSEMHRIALIAHFSCVADQGGDGHALSDSTDQFPRAVAVGASWALVEDGDALPTEVVSGLSVRLPPLPLELAPATAAVALDAGLCPPQADQVERGNPRCVRAAGAWTRAAVDSTTSKLSSKVWQSNQSLAFHVRLRLFDAHATTSPSAVGISAMRVRLARALVTAEANHDRLSTLSHECAGEPTKNGASADTTDSPPSPPVSPPSSPLAFNLDNMEPPACLHSVSGMEVSGESALSAVAVADATARLLSASAADARTLIFGEVDLPDAQVTATVVGVLENAASPLRKIHFFAIDLRAGAPDALSWFIWAKFDGTIRDTELKGAWTAFAHENIMRTRRREPSLVANGALRTNGIRIRANGSRIEHSNADFDACVLSPRLPAHVSNKSGSAPPSAPFDPRMRPREAARLGSSNFGAAVSSSYSAPAARLPPPVPVAQSRSDRIAAILSGMDPQILQSLREAGISDEEIVADAGGSFEPPPQEQPPQVAPDLPPVPPSSIASFASPSAATLPSGFSEWRNSPVPPAPFSFGASPFSLGTFGAASPSDTLSQQVAALQAAASSMWSQLSGTATSGGNVLSASSWNESRPPADDAIVEPVQQPGSFPAAASFPSGGFPPGAFPPGAFPPGAFPPGAFPPGAFPPGPVPKGAIPPGASSRDAPALVPHDFDGRGDERPRYGGSGDSSVSAAYPDPRFQYNSFHSKRVGRDGGADDPSFGLAWIAAVGDVTDQSSFDSMLTSLHRMKHASRNHLRRHGGDDFDSQALASDGGADAANDSSRGGPEVTPNFVGAIRRGRVAWDILVITHGSTHESGGVEDGIAFGVASQFASVKTGAPPAGRCMWVWQGDGSTFHGQERRAFGDSVLSGDIVTVEVDLGTTADSGTASGTLEVFLNGKSQGFVFDNSVGGPPTPERALLPIIGMYREGDVVRLLGVREGLHYRHYARSRPDSREAAWFKHVGMWKAGQQHGEGVLLVAAAGAPAAASPHPYSDDSSGSEALEALLSRKNTASNVVTRAIAASAEKTYGEGASPLSDRDHCATTDAAVEIAGFFSGTWTQGAMSGAFQYFALPPRATAAVALSTLPADLCARLLADAPGLQSLQLSQAPPDRATGAAAAAFGENWERVAAAGPWFLFEEGVLVRRLEPEEEAAALAARALRDGAAAEAARAVESDKGKPADCTPRCHVEAVRGTFCTKTNQAFAWTTQSSSAVSSASLDSVCAKSSNATLVGSQGFTSGRHSWAILFESGVPVSSQLPRQLRIGVAERNPDRALLPSLPVACDVSTAALNPFYEVAGQAQPTVSRHWSCLSDRTLSGPMLSGIEIFYGGDCFTQGDIIYVHLDMEAGTLSLSRDTRYRHLFPYADGSNIIGAHLHDGVAFKHLRSVNRLPTNGGTGRSRILYPFVSLEPQGRTREGVKISICNMKWLSEAAVSPFQVLAANVSTLSLLREWDLASSSAPAPSVIRSGDLPPHLRTSTLDAFRVQEAWERGCGEYSLRAYGFHVRIERSHAAIRRAFDAAGVDMALFPTLRGGDVIPHVISKYDVGGDRAVAIANGMVVAGAALGLIWCFDSTEFDNSPITETGAPASTRFGSSGALWYYTPKELEMGFRDEAWTVFPRTLEIEADAAAEVAAATATPTSPSPDEVIAWALNPSTGLPGVPRGADVPPSPWTDRDDEALVAMVNNQCRQSGANPSALVLTHTDAGPFWASPKGLPLNRIRARFALLSAINSSLPSILPLVDFSMLRSRGVFTAEPRALDFLSILGARFAARRRMLFFDTKRVHWTTVLKSTIDFIKPANDTFDGPEGFREDHGEKFEINMMDTLRRGSEATTRSQRRDVSCFGKFASFLEAKQWTGRVFTRALLSTYTHAHRYLWALAGTQARAFSYQEEKGDGDGPYRAFITSTSRDDAVSLGLVVPTPNAKAARPDASDEEKNAMLVNFAPYLSSSAEVVPMPVPPPEASILADYRFWGSLVGLSVRAELPLTLDMPPFVWRPLVGLPIRTEDIATVDVELAEKLWAVSGVDERTASLADLRSAALAAVRALGQWAPPHAEEAAAAVGFNTRSVFLAYLRAAAARQGNAGDHADAFYVGLDSVLPSEIFSMWSPEELETLVMGRPECSKKDLWSLLVPERLTLPTQQWLLRTIESWDQRKNGGFLRLAFFRFVTARTRIPNDANELTKISVVVVADTSILPTAQTCFHKLTIAGEGSYSPAPPGYDTPEAYFADRLEFAITNCTSIEHR